MKFPCIIAEALLAPESLKQYTAQDWDLLVRQGRRANLLAKLTSQLECSDLLSNVPEAPRLHLISALKMTKQQNVGMRWEIDCIHEALAGLNIPVVILKGAAYLASELEIALGRNFSDVDILVPKELIGKVESHLMIHGWNGSNHDEYDQKYYRQWMHEIPPMRHVVRGTTIDVHHSILPETARIKVNSSLLFDHIQQVPGKENIFVLDPVDMVLHSATHLFHEGELENGLRDLFDLDGLFKQLNNNPAYWEEINFRANKLGVVRPLFYAIRYTTQILNTPIPSPVISQSMASKPSPITLAIIDFCYKKSLQPVHSSCNSFGTSLARSILYLRSHWIRMPFLMLAHHLGRKWFMNIKKSKTNS
jgi:hypothetical protein